MHFTLKYKHLEKLLTSILCTYQQTNVLCSIHGIFTVYSIETSDFQTRNLSTSIPFLWTSKASILFKKWSGKLLHANHLLISLSGLCTFAWKSIDLIFLLRKAPDRPAQLVVIFIIVHIANSTVSPVWFFLILLPPLYPSFISA